MIKKCVVCGGEFEALQPYVSRKTCSEKCRGDRTRTKNREQAARWRAENKERWRAYCNGLNAKKREHRPLKTCIVCNTLFRHPGTTTICCSNECRDVRAKAVHFATTIAWRKKNPEKCAFYTRAWRTRNIDRARFLDAMAARKSRMVNPNRHRAADNAKLWKRTSAIKILSDIGFDIPVPENIPSKRRSDFRGIAALAIINQLDPNLIGELTHD